VSKKARPFSRRKAKAKRVRTEAAATVGRAARRALMRQQVITAASVYEAERRARNVLSARGFGRSARFDVAQRDSWKDEAEWSEFVRLNNGTDLWERRLRNAIEPLMKELQ
jgi:hypothetical protein